MATPSETPPSTCYASYVDYLGAHLSAWPQYEWLHRFLQHKPSCCTTAVTVFDIIGENIKETMQYSVDFTGLTDGLSSRPSESEVRLVVVSYEEIWSCSREVVEHLGVLYDVDPEFFRRHLYFHFNYVENSAPATRSEDKYEKRAFYIPCRESVDQAHLSFTREYEKLSAYRHLDPSTGNATVLIWVRSTTRIQGAYFSPFIRPSIYSLSADVALGNQQTRPHRYISALRIMSGADVKAGCDDFYYFLTPYILDTLLRFYDEFKAEHAPEDLTRINQTISSVMLHTLDSKLIQLQLHTVGFRAFRREVQRIRKLIGTSPARPDYEMLHDDIVDIQSRMEAAVLFYRDSKRDIMTTAQIEEARVSTALAITVNRLTKLAFAFIPLTFTTSIFGMNVTELGQGTTQLRWVFVTGAAVLVTTMLPLLPSLWRATQQPNVVLSRQVFVALARKWPLGSFWFLLLWFMVDYELLESLCGVSLAQGFELEPSFVAENLSPQVREARLKRSVPNKRWREFLESRAAMLEEYGTRRLYDLWANDHSGE